MGEHNVDRVRGEESLRSFTRALLRDVQALERMIAEDRIESGIRRIGAEQEMFIVDNRERPALDAERLLKEIDNPAFTTELAQFNLECNLPPHVFGGDCLRTMEQELRNYLVLARDVAQTHDESVVLTGILPTLRQNDLSLDCMTPVPRYLALNDAMCRLRGGEFNFRIKGIDELEATHDNVMLESCNTSFQIHFQVAAEEFPRLYNIAQVITAPVLAAAVNSPLLLGKRLWHETRIALFQQSIDARHRSQQARGLPPRVSFGEDWVRDTVLEIFREDIARYRVVLAVDVEEDPLAVLDAGGIPLLSALRLHNGTVYRWNRPCYGVADGVAHLRIENRVLPAGPTVIDEMANAAFFFGLMASFAARQRDITEEIRFDCAKENFTVAARQGLRANFRWLGGREIQANDLITELLPEAERGLLDAGIDRDDVQRYLGVLEARVQSGRTGSQWALDSLAAMGDSSTPEARLRCLTRAAIQQQRVGRPIHNWELATGPDDSLRDTSFLTVGQYMTTDLFTVRPQDVIDLAASLMDWRHIRHVPVEDDEGRLVGLVSHRSLLRLVGQGDSSGIAVAEIMKADPLSIAPDTATLDAISIMREHRVGCLPVVDTDKRLMGIITERDLISVAARLLEDHLKNQSAR